MYVFERREEKRERKERDVVKRGERRKGKGNRESIVVGK